MTMSSALIAGRYRLVSPLGNGGMGRVWLARDEMLHRDVAVKEVNLPADMPHSEREELRVRTLREARTTARLSHPNVVQMYDVLQFDDRPWIVMEYVRSRSLQRILQEEGPVAPARAAVIGLAILRALAAAHAAGVLHRDVKPGNVLIADDGRVVLTDFGLATFEGGEGSMTTPGLVWGSPEYVAPERARHGVSSVEADLWSFGATLYAAVEGASPYARPSAMASLTALATEKPPVPANAGVLKPVITGLLRKDPRTRLRASEVERMLRRTAEGDSRSRPRRLPRQRGGVDSGSGGSVVPIPSYALPEPPAGDTSRPTETATAVPDGVSPVAPVAAPPTLPPLPGPGDTGPGAVPAAPGRRGWLIAVAAVLLAVALGGATALIVDRRAVPGADSAGGAGPGTATGPGRSTGPTSVVTSSPPVPADRVAPFPGWTFYEETGRFRMMAPIGWRIERDGTVTRLHEPDGPKVLSVNRWPVPGGNPIAAAQQVDREWAAGTGDGPAGYRLVTLRPIEYFVGGLEWEYTYTDPDIGPMRTVSRWFVDRGTCYAIGVSLPGYDIGARSSYFNQLIGGFQPR